MKVKVQGFIISDSFPQTVYQEFVKDMNEWLTEEKIKYTEQVIEGLENAPTALNDLLVGKSFGKMVVRVS